MSSDVCKHCTHAACLDVCPTGALFRTEFGTVVVQEDICNGCGYCVPACPYGVIDKREDDGRVFKCTLCYDRLGVGQEPACAKACPTESIQFGDARRAARARAPGASSELHAAGVARGAPVRPRPGRRRRRRRRVLPAARRARGLRPAARPGRDDPRPAGDVAARRVRPLARGGGRVVRAAARPWPASPMLACAGRGRSGTRRARRGPEAEFARTTAADPQAADVGGARHRRLPVPRRPGRRVVAARRRRRAHRPARAGAAPPKLCAPARSRCRSPRWSTTWAARRGFVNMLRVFKPTSPMSVGVWLLAAYAPLTAAAARERRHRAARRASGGRPRLGAGAARARRSRPTPPC